MLKENLRKEINIDFKNWNTVHDGSLLTASFPEDLSKNSGRPLPAIHHAVQPREGILDKKV